MTTVSAFASVDSTVIENNTLQLIADELNVSEGRAFSTLVNQQRIMSYRNVMTIFMAIASGYMFIRLLKLGSKKDNQVATTDSCNDTSYEWSVRYVLPIAVSGILMASSIIYNSVMLEETFTGLFNPEYGALEQLKFIGS